MTIGDNNNDWDYSYRLMFSIGHQTKMMYPPNFDRIGELNFYWWKWGMNPAEPEKMVQREKVSLLHSKCSQEYFDAMGNN